MFKHLTLAFCASALFTGCVITSGDTTDTFGTETTNNTVPETEGTGTTADEPTTGGTSAGTATESAEGTTVEPETTGPTTGATETATATEPATETTAETGNTTSGVVGGCGWFESDVSYYACEVDGGVPGAEDPMMQFPIACPDGLAAGDPCTEDMPIASVGCCSADGHNFYCDIENGVLFDQDCSE